jgi:hypothetical protein
LAGFLTAGGVGCLRDGSPVALFAAFGRLVPRLFLLPLLLVLLLLRWLLVFNIRQFQGCSLLDEFLQGVNCAAGVHYQSNCCLDVLVKACPSNIVEDFFMLL